MKKILLLFLFSFLLTTYMVSKIKKLGKAWHLGKVLFEKWWLAPYGFSKSFYKILIQLGAESLKIPFKL